MQWTSPRAPNTPSYYQQRRGRRWRRAWQGDVNEERARTHAHTHTHWLI